MGALRGAKQQDPAGKYDEYPQENRETADGARVYHYDSQGGLPDAGKPGNAGRRMLVRAVF